MAWRSSGTNNESMVDNLKREYSVLLVLSSIPNNQKRRESWRCDRELHEHLTRLGGLPIITVTNTTTKE